MEFRTIDGSGNNLAQPTLNAAGTDFTRIGPAHFADGIHAPPSGPNARMISNVVVGDGDAEAPGPEGLSALMFAWGQFIDHDLDLNRPDGVNHIDIVIPADDAVFPPGSVIPVTRAIIDPATGQDAAHPAIQVNSITGWLDASMVYGSDAATAASLRLPDGHLKTSAGNNLPIVNGAFAAGDVRVNENPALASLHTLFMREHNHQVDLLHKQHPGWSGEQLYQHARAIVIAEIEHITFEEFLPHLIGPNALSDYQGYDDSVDPRITAQFAGAAFRFGHSIVTPQLSKVGEQGQVLEVSDLQDVFFAPPAAFAANGGAAAVLRGLVDDASPALDARIVDALRNFLFDPPGGQDLAAINIQRGRDMGLGTLNENRIALGLQPYTDFDQITSDPATAANLETAYGDVDLIDLWVGGLAEDHAPGALLGPTFQAILALQFGNLRDGDRFWYENGQFDAQTLFRIEHTTLSDIIERNTGVEHVQDDAFVYYDRHGGQKSGIGAEDPNARQLVIGSNGGDTLIGGPQGDMLVPGKGRQLLTGGDGDDAFVFSGPGISAKITDFEPGHDKLVFEGGKQGIAFHHLHVSFHHGSTTVQVAGDTIELVGIKPGQLSPQDFDFGG